VSLHDDEIFEINHTKITDLWKSMYLPITSNHTCHNVC